MILTICALGRDCYKLKLLQPLHFALLVYMLGSSSLFVAQLARTSSFWTDSLHIPNPPPFSWLYPDSRKSLPWLLHECVLWEDASFDDGNAHLKIWYQWLSTCARSLGSLHRSCQQRLWSELLVSRKDRKCDMYPDQKEWGLERPVFSDLVCLYLHTGDFQYCFSLSSLQLSSIQYLSPVLDV